MSLTDKTDVVNIKRLSKEEIKALERVITSLNAEEQVNNLHKIMKVPGYVHRSWYFIWPALLAKLMLKIDDMQGEIDGLHSAR